jgi:hypothetical protein
VQYIFTGGAEFARTAEADERRSCSQLEAASALASAELDIISEPETGETVSAGDALCGGNLFTDRSWTSVCSSEKDRSDTVLETESRCGLES